MPVPEELSHANICFLPYIHRGQGGGSVCRGVSQQDADVAAPPRSLLHTCTDLLTRFLSRFHSSFLFCSAKSEILMVTQLLLVQVHFHRLYIWCVWPEAPCFQFKIFGSTICWFFFFFFPSALTTEVLICALELPVGLRCSCAVLTMMLLLGSGKIALSNHTINPQTAAVS